MRITQALSRAASVRPNHVATIDGARRRSWKEVADRIARFAAALRALGIEDRDRVAVLARNCDLFYEAYYAVAWAGAVIVPLNTRLALPEIEFQLDDCGAKALLFSAEFAEAVVALRKRSGAHVVIGLDGTQHPADQGYDALIAASEPAADRGRSDDDLAAIFYTGGTTGPPKGVMLSHRNLVAMAMNLIMAIKIDEDCVNLHSAPMFHLADIGTFMTTLVAGTHVFVPKLDEASMFDAIERHRVTHVFTVPVVIDRLASDPAERRFSSLRFLGYGGAPMPPAVLERARKRFASVAFGQGFGMTEMGAATFLGPRHHAADADPKKLASAGQPCFGYELMVIGPDGAELPRGAIGEIVGRGDNVMLGYWDRSEETAAALTRGWMHSGDVGYMDEDGFVYINDRLKDMIVTGAENVYSTEVEHIIYRHPAIGECAVVGLPDEKWGERVHAVLVLKSGAATLSLEELTAFCRQHIAGFKCPKSLEIRAEPLPRTAAGKVRKIDLRPNHDKRATPL